MHSFPEKTEKKKEKTGNGSQSMEGQPHNFVTQNDTHKRAAQPKHLETYM